MTSNPDRARVEEIAREVFGDLRVRFEQSFLPRRFVATCIEIAGATADRALAEQREWLMEEIEVLQGCGDCDPCIGGREDECAVGAIKIKVVRAEWLARQEGK